MKDFPHFLGAEEQNLIVSCLRLKKEFDALSNLDSLFSAAIARIDVPSEERFVPAMLLFVHYHLYVSAAAFARGHLSECFASTRKAIDATFTAYEMILDPATTELYLTRDRRFLSIKSHIAKARAADSSTYPLAEDLIRLHDTYSEYGSHADIGSFVHRVEQRDTEEPTKSLFSFYYFQLPPELSECRFHLLGVLHAYYQMLVIFEQLLRRCAKGLGAEWFTGLHTFGASIQAGLEAARRHIDTERGDAPSPV